MTRPVIAFVLLLAGLTRAGEPPYPLFHTDPTPFLRALETIADTPVLEQRIAAVTVPHHLLAAEVIARPLRMASGGSYERIIILTPDHWKRSTTTVATTTRDFITPLGIIPSDRAAATHLLEHPIVSHSNLFSHEHGVRAILPFLARDYPGVPILAVAIDVRSKPSHWKSLAEALRPLFTTKTLLIQSTDFSHYLPAAEAAKRDAESLRILAIGDPAGIEILQQPQHLDSLAAQWITLDLTRARGCLPPIVVENRNAVEFGPAPDDPRTTSYISQLHSPGFIPAANLPGSPWFFGGDTHFGRHVADLLSDPAQAGRIDSAILDVTGGGPLVLNLEGVMIDDPPSFNDPAPRIAMPVSATLDRLRRWNVRAAVLANNHTLDFGPQALEAMTVHLRSAGITPLRNGATADLGKFTLATATDLQNQPRPRGYLLDPASFEAWSDADQGKPLVAFLHCGREFSAPPTARVHLLAEWAEQAGASVVLGAHPHRPSPRWFLGERSLQFPSLGNLLFDQSNPLNSGGLVELRFFPQGTFAARWIPLGNLYSGEKSATRRSMIRTNGTCRSGS